MRKYLVRVVAWAVVCVTAIAATAAPAEAQRISLIRDAEIENTIRAYATPLFRAAGLSPDSVAIHIVNDDSLNAFVAAGQNLFIHTGLLMRSENASQVIGVIAHETGHIAGGHLVRTHEAIENASAQALLGVLLGAAAAVGGRPDVGGAIMSGAQQVGERQFLQFSRTQESAADQAALKYLDATDQSAKGILEFLDILGEQELLSVGQQDPYVRTHPLTRDRVDAVRAHVQKSRLSDEMPSEEFRLMHARMKAKLVGFVRPMQRVMRTYPESDESLPARYARSIAYYRVGNLDKALPLIDSLISEHPNDPYFHELKGQMLFENGRGDEALPSYEKAVELRPQSPLLRVELAKAQIERNDPALRERAIEHLQYALDRNPKDPSSWRHLSIAYGKNGRMAESSLALAEEALLQRNNVDAIGLAKRAQDGLKEGSPDWLRAADIIAIAQENQKAEQR